MATISYYTKTETDSLNTSQTNYILENNQSVYNFIINVNSSMKNYVDDTFYKSGDAATFATVDTGEGANELFDMDQNVLKASTPEFAGVNMTFNNVTSVDCIIFESGGRICSES